MNKPSFKTRKPAAVAPERNQWRARQDQPLSLTRQRADTASTQRLLVLGFAAVAIAGGAYFATAMLSEHAGKTSVISSAEAQPAPKPVAPVAPAPAKPAVATASAATTPTVSGTPAPKPASQAAADALPGVNVDGAPIKPTVQALKIEPLDGPQAASKGSFPAPVRVKSITITSQSAAAQRQPSAEPETSVVSDSSETTVAAYSGDTKELVSEGVAAVLRAVEDDPDQAKSAKAEASEQGKRRIRSGVNMRARPQSGSQIIGTIPSNALVSVAPGCKQWCAVSYNGKRGYIYKSFLR